MTTEPDQPTSARPARPAPSAAADAVFRHALRGMLVLLAALAVLGVGIGALVAGRRGVWGALIGIALALVFSGTTVVSMLVTAGSSLQKLAAVVMGAWLGKVVVVIVVLALLQDLDFYDKPVLAVVLLVGVVGSAFLDYRSVSRGRVPYVEPGAPRPDPRPDGGTS
jgi:hypothetical protein